MSDEQLASPPTGEIKAEVSAIPEHIAQLAMQVLSGHPRSKTMPGATLIMAAYIVAKTVMEKSGVKNDP